MTQLYKLITCYKSSELIGLSHSSSWQIMLFAQCSRLSSTCTPISRDRLLMMMITTTIMMMMTMMMTMAMILVHSGNNKFIVENRKLSRNFRFIFIQLEPIKVTPPFAVTITRSVITCLASVNFWTRVDELSDMSHISRSHFDLFRNSVNGSKQGICSSVVSWNDSTALPAFTRTPAIICVSSRGGSREFCWGANNGERESASLYGGLGARP